MARYLARRMAGALLVVVIVAAAVFWLFELLPGDAATILLSRQGAGQPDPRQLEMLRAELGLDRPALERFAEWAAGLAGGDLGVSLLSQRPVSEIIAPLLGNSMVLAAVTVAILIPLSVTLGLAAGARPGTRLDKVVSSVALSAESVPPFVIGVLCISWLALGLGWFPAVSLVPRGTSPLERPEILVLPVLCLLCGLAPHPIRVARAQMGEVMSSDYITAARINGIPERRLVLRHAAPNALSAALHPLAGAVVGLVGGIAIVEVLFAYPGLAHELLRAISGRDLPFVQSAAVLLAAFGVFAYLIADIVAMLLTPSGRNVLRR
ncbi:ABC transporter permease [Mycobacterium sp. MS1601]|uniref:ABC transporter permease n=1 Tax=Mycobacterium sp. MS1601 TaxID=1936029 RepID=UPI000979746D|nr:ABC transporter permease [Mycobacterium sp. MS1601]AQA02189.1 ABC transporter permease [Mycobacterium sp. MS1601]